jgi:hypothetical protein
MLRIELVEIDNVFDGQENPSRKHICTGAQKA